MAIKNKIVLRAAHIAGRKNILADQLSRNKIFPTEWTLNDQVVQTIFSIWGNPMIDLFASGDNHKAPVFCVWIPHYKALAVDALTISWENMWAHAFTHESVQMSDNTNCSIVAKKTLVHRTSTKVNSKTNKHSFTKKSSASTKTQIYHPNAEVFKLTAWLLTTEISEIKAFHETLESSSGHPGDLVQNKITQANSKSLIAGIVRGKKIPIRQIRQIVQIFLHLCIHQVYNIALLGYRLLKRVFNSRPPKVKLVPEWDLHKILDMLQKSPFEPLREAEIKFVTYKVIFRTAITTFRRCSDLQALRIGEGFVNVQSRGITF
ncbi:unnamed protein product [Mytilus coruscus]|uniref:Uncharacterized protein n=1 Tax=Mytilus coruscus TaxID=42192 RepID=A0A6J8DFZ3_MYTCO|nr:unnamed protein product [Mytilus coruscus]